MRIIPLTHTKRAIDTTSLSIAVRAHTRLSQMCFIITTETALLQISTEQSGLLSIPAAHGLGVAIGDADNDGDIDIYLANDQDFQLPL